MHNHTILHCDLNNFFANATLIDKPELKDLPVAIAGDSSKRHGIILAKNMAAKIKGVKTAEPIWQAMQKSPNLIILSPDYQLYIKYSNIVKAIYYRYTGNIESFGIDECWLDIDSSDFNQEFGYQTAMAIKETIKHETGLTASIGVSFSKTFAKLGSDYKKPDAITVISKNNYRSFVWPMPVRNLLCVGRKTEKKLLSISLNTIGDLANCDDFILKNILGKNGIMLKQYANGAFSSLVKSVCAHDDFNSIGNGMTTSRDLHTDHEVFSSFLMLCEMVSTRLMKKEVCAQCIAIHLKDTELKSITRQTTLETPIFVADDLAKTAMQLFRKNWNINKQPLRALTIQTREFTSLSKPGQVSFFDTKKDIQKTSLALVKKKIMDKYGNDAITRATFMLVDTPKAKGHKEQHIVHPTSFPNK